MAWECLWYARYAGFTWYVTARRKGLPVAKRARVRSDHAGGYGRRGTGALDGDSGS
jgi:hypothetical protein